MPFSRGFYDYLRFVKIIVVLGWLVACGPSAIPTATPIMNAPTAVTVERLATPTLIVRPVSPVDPTVQLAPTLPAAVTPVLLQTPSIPLRLALTPGAAEMVLSGVAIAPYGNSYLFSAQAGQKITLAVDSAENVANFELVGLSDGQPYKRLVNEDRAWSGSAAVTQDYLLTVNTPQQVTDYTLTLTLGADGMPPAPTPRAPVAQPVAAAAYISLAGWSPDSQWLAYWLSSAPEVEAQAAYGMPGGALYFTNIYTGELCPTTLVTQREGEARVSWSETGQAQVTWPTGSVVGRPCQSAPFTPASAGAPPPAAADPAVSPDGRYRATTTRTADQAGILTFETRLTARDGGATLAQATWQIDERLGDYAGWLGGEWAGPTQFVIEETLTQGPLVLDVAGQVTAIARDVLGLLKIPSILDAEGYQWRAYTLPGATSDAYHLLLSGVGLEGNFPPVRVFHAESGVVEMLPYRYGWERPVSADSRWLLLDERLNLNGYETHVLRIRLLEEVGGAWQPLAFDSDSLLWSDDGAQIAFTQAERRLVRQTFPAGEALGAWSTDPYWVSPIRFSPDGRFLAAVGNRPGEWAYGLFVIGESP